MEGVYYSQGVGNPWKGLFPSQWISIKRNPSHTPWNPGQDSIPMLGGSAGGIPNHAMSSNFGNTPMMQQHTQVPFGRHDHHGIYQKLGQQSNFS
jgi:hypothetical protein